MKATSAMRAAHPLAVALLAAAAPAAAQDAGKRPITPDVYDTWRSIQGATLSADGAWAAYSLVPQVGDGELVVRSTRTATEYRVPRGFIGRPQTEPAADSGYTAPPARFSADSRYVVALAFPPKAEFDRARGAKTKPAEKPKGSLAITSLADGSVAMIPRVKSFRLPKESGRYVAYLLEPADSVAAAAADDSAAAAAPPAGVAAALPGGVPRPVAADSADEQGDRKETGSTLVLRELATGAEVRMEDVTAYTFDERGGWLAYTVSSPTGARDGAYVRSLADGRERALLTGAGSYKQLAFDRAGTQVAFLSDRDEAGREKPRYTLYHASLTAPAARAVVTAAAVGDSAVIAEKGDVEFTRDGSALRFGVTAPPLDSVPADSLDDRAVFDLWHYRDARLQPQQRVQATREGDHSHAAVYQLRARRWVRLGSDSFPEVTVADDGRAALGVTDLPYGIEAMWGEGGSDVYLFDATTGRRTLVARRVPFGAELSPGGKYVLWFDKGRWFSYATASGKTADLTGALAGVRFDQETWDTPGTPAPWGVAGWTRGDRAVVLNSRYDLWEVDPSGARPARVATDSVGTRERLVFRLADLDPDDPFIDPAAPVLLEAFHDSTKASGFYRDQLGVVSPPERLVMADRRFGAPIKARNANVYLVSQSTFTDFPDVWAGARLDSLTRLSNANPQQRQYRWGSAELVRWRSDDGKPLQGILYKPDGFDPARRYPTVVYFYEQLSDNLHQYHAPAGRNVVNPTVYTSNGYVVFFPDIAYTNGYPGPSALKSIVPGVQMLVARGVADPDAIASAGQSWGGYQTAYMITQSNLFKAAFAGAPVANMTSAYGGIRWESGVARAFQYEKTQSRIGGSLWQYPMRYIENSPLFAADRVRTPVLIMANDNDGAVPWYQGIELFVALRRLGKEAYLVNYNGDGHNPRKRANQKDIDLRMQQFFAHHLKGEPAPAWMRHGIPFLRKGRDQEAPVATSAPAATGGTSGAAGEGRRSQSPP